MSKQSKEEQLARLKALREQQANNPSPKPKSDPQPQVDVLQVAAQNTKQAVGVASKAVGEAGSKMLAAAKDKAEEAKRVLEEKREAMRALEERREGVRIKQEQERQAKQEREAQEKLESSRVASATPATVKDDGYIEPKASGYVEAVVSAPVVEAAPKQRTPIKIRQRSLLIAGGVLAVGMIAVGITMLPKKSEEPVALPVVEQGLVDEAENLVPEVVQVSETEVVEKVSVPVQTAQEVPEIEVAPPTEIEPANQPAPKAVAQTRSAHAERQAEQKPARRTQPEPDPKPTWQDDANNELDQLENLLN